MGRRKLFLWPGVEGDGSIHSRTPAKTGRSEGVERLHKMIRKYDQKELPVSVSSRGRSRAFPRALTSSSGQWLDKLSLRRIEAIQKEAQDVSVEDESKVRA